METMYIKDVTGKILYEGTKHDCMHFIKVRRLNRNEIVIEPLTVEPEQPIIKTTAPVASKPKGFFKRIFS